jgi:hypothetical protein
MRWAMLRWLLAVEAMMLSVHPLALQGAEASS